MFTALALTLTSFTPCQDLAAAMPAALQIPSPENRPLLYDRPGDGRLWAVGQNWKASFGADGVTYYPILGADAPATQVQFTLTGTSVSDKDIALSGVQSIDREGDVVTLDRGAVQETWNLARTGIEQTFVFDALPARGDLELEIRMTTDLAQRRSSDALVLESPSAAVRYGAAIAIDAAGRTVPVERTETHFGFTLRVPSAFVTDAQLPLVVDPIVQNLGPIAPSTQVQRNPAAAFGLAIPGSGTSSEYIVAWEELTNGTDLDVYAMALDSSGSIIPNSMTIVDATNETWRTPSIAFHRQSQTFLIVAETRMPGGSFNIRGRQRALGTGSMGAPLPIATRSFIDERSPDVGGFDITVGGTSNHFMVVWEEESGNGDRDIRGRHVRGDGLFTGSSLDLATGPDDDQRPSISKGPGSPFFGFYWHNIVWQRNPQNPNPKNYARRATTDGSALTGELLAGPSQSQHRATASETLRDPMLPDGSLPFVVASRSTSGIHTGLYATIVGNAGLHSGTNVTNREGFATPLESRSPVIMHTGRGVTIAYASMENGGHTLRATSLGPVRNHSLGSIVAMGAGERALQVAGNINGTAQFAVASMAEGGSQQDDALFVWNDLGVIHAATFEGPASQLRPILGSQFCDATPNSTGERGWISGRGHSEVISQKHIFAESLPPGAFGFMVVGSNPGGSMPAGSDGRICIGGQIGRFTNMVQQASAMGTMEFSFFPFDIPQGNGSTAAQAGDEFYFQVWHRDINAAGATSNLTNALSIAFE